MYQENFETVDDLLSYLGTTSMYCVEKENKYINFPPIPVMEYFQSESMIGEYFDGNEYQSIEFKPELKDLAYLRTFKFEDLTFRGTIEFRSVCCQPICDCMTVAAFHLGLQEKLHELDELLQKDHVLYHHGYTASELRQMFTYDKLPFFVKENELYALAEQVVGLAEEGLAKRGKGEEIYLKPLYSRIKSRQNPARQMLAARDRGVPLEDIIQSYSELD